MKKTVLAAALGMVTLFGASYAEMKKVYVNQIVEHPALDQTARGIKDGLEKRGYKAGENLDYRVESAQGNIALASQISSKFVSQKADVTVGIGTTSAQSLVKAANEGKTKMIFSSITDPLTASLVTKLSGSNSNVTGMSNKVDVVPQFELFKELLPNLKTIGFIYNPAEANSIQQLDDVQKAAKQLGLTIVEQAVNKTSDVPQAATRLAGRTDALFIYGDNTALAALESIVMAATKEKKPVFVADTDAVELGALAALGPNQYDLGLDTAEMIADVLDGKDINTIDVGFPSGLELYINQDAADKLGYTFPEAVTAKAAKIIKKD
ncbi:ABC transporter substrate-binding protein [Wohlfahrtiimonas chitiniclastica]|uniref:ABC transporter substrate-binding protein n=1 Tax=Wohlfahrtiimonas chitiniclastica TaxID=400946 RepID=UPI0003790AAD|nr:ABC transporter substrate-binding protein [Wohlfahrtiimonas chitiniclastica]MBS7834367.1 ABC transporter substrate-binding protein [Wohlfahrtiimonas chitiniclastica]